MSFEFKLPSVGENVEKADVGNLRVAVGDVIEAQQVVMEIETDKAVFDLPCPHAGRVVRIHVKSGDTVHVGSPLLDIEAVGAAAPAPAPVSVAPASAAPAPAAPAPTPTPPADPVASLNERQIAGLAASVFSAAPSFATTSNRGMASAAAPSPVAVAPAVAAPVVASPVPPPVPAPVVASVAPPAPVVPVAQVAETEAADATDAADGANGLPAPAAPATRRLARELGVDLFKVQGSGPGGRITQEDVQAFVKSILTQPPAAPVAPPAAAESTAGRIVAPPLPDFSQYGPIERQQLNKIMRTGANNLSLAWSVIPHVTQHELADVTDLEAARKRFAQAHAGREGSPKITMTVLVMKAVVTALKAFPRFNSSYDPATGEVILKRYYHLGVAVDTENGLMVPVVRNVDSKSVVQVAAEIGDLAARARERKLGLADMQGGTFTITNLGGIGGTYFTPIVNYPEVAILGMSRSSQQMVVVDGKPEVRLMLPLSLSYDHRVINGADAARFIVKLSGLLSDPFQLLSEV